MHYISCPNLPEAPVRLAVVDGRIEGLLEQGFTHRGIRLIKTDRMPLLYEAIAFHPDIMLHHISSQKMIYAPGTSPRLLKQLADFGFVLIRGETELAARYPLDIAYNVARVGALAFHHTRYTDPAVKRELFREDVELVHVKQGYAKCATAVIDHRSIITADRGIACAAEKKGLDVLLLEPQKEIRLAGLDYGFIGGSSGRIGKDQWGVTGDIARLKDYLRMTRFVEERNIQAISITKGQMEDIGSIIPLLTE